MITPVRECQLDISCRTCSFCILEVIIHNIGGIQAEFGSSLRLGSVIQNEELIRTGAGCLIYALGREGILNEQLGSIGVLSALEDGGSADLEGGTGGRNDQGDVLVAVVEDLGDTIMQEADADDALAGANRNNTRRSNARSKSSSNTGNH